MKGVHQYFHDKQRILLGIWLMWIAHTSRVKLTMVALIFARGTYEVSLVRAVLVCVARFDSRGAAGVAFVRSWQMLPPCPTQPRPAGSKTEMPLAKAKLLHDSSSTSGIMYLGRGKNLFSSRRENWEFSILFPTSVHPLHMSSVVFF